MCSAFFKLKPYWTLILELKHQLLFSVISERYGLELSVDELVEFDALKHDYEI